MTDDTNDIDGIQQLENLLELLGKHNVASYEREKNRVKIVFYSGNVDDDAPSIPTDSLDGSRKTNDRSDTSSLSQNQKPKPEGPYPSDVFPDGEAPTFGT